MLLKKTEKKILQRSWRVKQSQDIMPGPHTDSKVTVAAAAEVAV